MGLYMLLFMIIKCSKRLESVHLFSNQEIGEGFLKCLYAYLQNHSCLQFCKREYSDNYFITIAIILPISSFFIDFIWMTLSHKGL